MQYGSELRGLACSVQRHILSFNDDHKQGTSETDGHRLEQEFWTLQYGRCDLEIGKLDHIDQVSESFGCDWLINRDAS